MPQTDKARCDQPQEFDGDLPQGNGSRIARVANLVDTEVSVSLLANPYFILMMPTRRFF